IFSNFVGAEKADSYKIGTFAALDAQDIPIEQGVLRLKLIRVQQVVVDSSKVAYIVRSPGHPYRTRAGDVNHRRRFNQVFGGLESGVTLANDEHPLPSELARINRDGIVRLRLADSRNWRDVRF